MLRTLTGPSRRSLRIDRSGIIQRKSARRRPFCLLSNIVLNDFHLDPTPLDYGRRTFGHNSTSFRNSSSTPLNFYHGEPLYNPHHQRVPSSFQCNQQYTSTPRRAGHFSAKDPKLREQQQDPDLSVVPTVSNKDDADLSKLSIDRQLAYLEDSFFQSGDPVQATRMLQAIAQRWQERRQSKERHHLVSNPKSHVAQQLRSLPTAQEMLAWIRQSRIPPNVATYQTLIDGVTAATATTTNFDNDKDCSDEKNLDQARFAHSLLERILERVAADLQESSTNSDSFELPEYSDISRSFRKVMSLYCQANEIPTAQELLTRLEQWEDNHRIDYLFPIRDTNYKVVLNAWAKTGRPRQADQVFQRLLQRAADSPERGAHLLRDARNMLEALLNSWVTSCDPQAGDRAEALLARMVGLYEAGYDTKPTMSSFSKAIAAWSNSKHKDAAQRAEDLLRLMCDVDWTVGQQSGNARRTVANTYLIVLRLWSSTKDKCAPDKCRELLLSLDASLGLANVPQLTLQKMYAALIWAWARSDRPDGPSNVQDIFIHMEKHREPGGLFASNSSNSGRHHFRWHMDVHTALLRAFARMGEGVKAETLLKRMLIEYLNTSQEQQKHQKQQKQQQQQQQQQGGMMMKEMINPMRTLNFNEVLLAWSKSKSDKKEAARRAEKLFGQMVSTGTDLQPDLVSYKALISALGKSCTAVETAQRGETYFRRMQEQHQIRPDTVAYTFAIRLWSNFRDTPEALERAQALLDEMRASGDAAPPDVKTYLAFLPILEQNSAHLSDSERQRRIAEVETALEQLGYLKQAKAKVKDERRHLLFRDVD